MSTEQSKILKGDNFMERKTISVLNRANQFKKIEQNKCNEMIIINILEPLLEIIYQLKESDNYNYIPGKVTEKEDGWDYYGNKFNEIYKAINNNIYLSEYEYRRIYDTVQGIQAFTRMFSGADGLPDMFFDANPNLNYFTFAFSEDGKKCKEFLKISQNNAPTDRDYLLSDAYHGNNAINNQKSNLRFDIDDFFIKELAYAVRKIFINIINEGNKQQN